MGVLQRFERRLGGLVEGAFAKVFKGGVEPVEIAGALARETDDRRAISSNRVLVPNEFAVELASPDYNRLSPYSRALCDELAEMVREHAAEQRYTFVGPVSIRLSEAPDLDVGVFRIRSSVASAEGMVATPQRRGPRAAPGVPRLLITNKESPPGREREYELTAESTLIGRSVECDIRLTDTGVSRRHGEIRRMPDGNWLYVDAGSTNGSIVNGRPATQVKLVNGDLIELGAALVTFQRDDGRGNRGDQGRLGAEDPEPFGRRDERDAPGGPGAFRGARGPDRDGRPDPRDRSGPRIEQYRDRAEGPARSPERPPSGRPEGPYNDRSGARGEPYRDRPKSLGPGPADRPAVGRPDEPYDDRSGARGEPYRDRPAGAVRPGGPSGRPDEAAPDDRSGARGEPYRDRSGARGEPYRADAEGRPGRPGQGPVRPGQGPGGPGPRRETPPGPDPRRQDAPRADGRRETPPRPDMRRRDSPRPGPAPDGLEPVSPGRPAPRRETPGQEPPRRNTPAREIPDRDAPGRDGPPRPDPRRRPPADDRSGPRGARPRDEAPRGRAGARDEPARAGDGRGPRDGRDARDARPRQDGDSDGYAGQGRGYGRRGDGNGPTPDSPVRQSRQAESRAAESQPAGARRAGGRDAPGRDGRPPEEIYDAETLLPSRAPGRPRPDDPRRRSGPPPPSDRSW